MDEDFKGKEAVKIISCEKTTNAEDIAKGVLYKAKIQYLENMSIKSKVELKPGTVVDIKYEGGEFPKDGKLVKWYRVVEAVLRK